KTTGKVGSVATSVARWSWAGSTASPPETRGGLQMSKTHNWDDSYDVVVVGSGTGLMGAITAARRGLRTLVCGGEGCLLGRLDRHVRGWNVAAEQQGSAGRRRRRYEGAGADLPGHPRW